MNHKSVLTFSALTISLLGSPTTYSQANLPQSNQSQTVGSSSTETRNFNIQKPYDLTFIDEMSRHHAEGIEMAQMAVEKAFHDELRTLAQKMVTDQTEERNKLQGWRTSWYPNAEPDDDRSISMRMEDLEALSGNAFDLAFLDSMIMHHPGAIYLGDEGDSRGRHRSLRRLANNIENKQIKELKTLRHWRADWDDANSPAPAPDSSEPDQVPVPDDDTEAPSDNAPTEDTTPEPGIENF